MRRLMMVIIAFIGCYLVSSVADGTELRYLGLDLAKFYNKRDPYFPPYHLLREASMDGEEGKETWNHHLSLNVNMDLITVDNGELYWNQSIIGNSTTVQYREVTWDWEIGINVRGSDRMKMFTPFWHHTSRHWLEGKSTEKRTNYPLEDFYGLKFCLHGCL